MSWNLGRPDGQNRTRSEMVEAIARIAATVDLPVSADVEGGYGPDADDVAATVTAVLEAGAVGINLEDSQAPGGPLFEREAQADRIRAARAAAVAAGLPELVINARPGLLDLDTLAELTSRITLPVNAVAGPGAPGVDELRAVGVRRISVGQAIAQAAYSLARRAAAEVVGKGTFDVLADADPFGDVNGAFPSRIK